MSTSLPEYAISSSAFPCNPRPFARRIDEIIQAEGNLAMSSARVKSCLLILVQQAWGQCCTLDTVESYGEIAAAMKVLEDAGAITPNA